MLDLPQIVPVVSSVTPDGNPVQVKVGGETWVWAGAYERQDGNAVPLYEALVIGAANALPRVLLPLADIPAAVNAAQLPVAV